MCNVGGSNKEVFALILGNKCYLNTSILPLSTCNTIENINIDKESGEDYRC